MLRAGIKLDTNFAFWAAEGKLCHPSVTSDCDLKGGDLKFWNARFITKSVFAGAQSRAL